MARTGWTAPNAPPEAPTFPIRKRRVGGTVDGLDVSHGAACREHAGPTSEGCVDLTTRTGGTAPGQRRWRSGTVPFRPTASIRRDGRNPDVLTCIANLSNDEVFTTPEIANRILDTLTEAWSADHDGANIWADPDVTFQREFDAVPEHVIQACADLLL